MKRKRKKVWVGWTCSWKEIFNTQTDVFYFLALRKMKSYYAEKKIRVTIEEL